MRARTLWAGAAVGVLLAGLIALGFRHADAPAAGAVLAYAASGAAAGRSATVSAAASAGQLPRAASLPEQALVVETRPLGSHQVPEFEVDVRGNVVMNAHTHYELERLLALNDRDDALALLRQLAVTLPPNAYRQATDAFYAYQSYSIAVGQAFPPGQQPVADEHEASRQLDALHALRVQHFGEDTAQAYFGDEETTARRLLANMRAQPAPAANR